MKLLIAIVQDEDASRLVNKLTQEGFGATKLATTGGFLRSGNTTLLIGVEDEKVDEVIEIIKTHSSKRSKMIPAGGAFSDGVYNGYPIEVSFGGATVFVTNVEQFRKL
jgi:uncharacterized protein YaaQ